MDYTIRVATEEDVELLTSLIRTAFRDVAECFNLTPENCPTHPSNCTLDWIRSALQKGAFYFILESHKEPCGCVALEMVNSDLCYLERLAVLPAFRERGFGKALVKHTLDQARALGVKNMEIGVISDQKELEDWYNRLGFVTKGKGRFKHLPFEVTFMRKCVSNTNAL